MGSGIRATSSAPSAGSNLWIRGHLSNLTLPFAEAKTVVFDTNSTSTPLLCKSTVTSTLKIRRVRSTGTSNGTLAAGT